MCALPQPLRELPLLGAQLQPPCELAQLPVHALVPLLHR